MTEGRFTEPIELTEFISQKFFISLDHHDWLLSDDIDILPILLLPLAGPEEFSETEIDQLPLDLQYLGDDKEREIDAEIRLMLVECLMMVRHLTKLRKMVDKSRQCVHAMLFVCVTNSKHSPIAVPKKRISTLRNFEIGDCPV